MAVLESPMSGKVFQVNVKEGDVVTPDDEPIVLESMKMEIPVQVEAECTVKKVLVAVGDNVNAGNPLLEF